VRFVPIPPLGHIARNDSKRVVLRVGSGLPVPLKLYNRSTKNLHWALPIVWAPKNQIFSVTRSVNKISVKYFYVLKIFIPESATRSVTLRFCFPNEAISWSTVEFGPGRFSLARVLFAVKLSLLPSGTSQVGPLAWKISEVEQKLTTSIKIK